MVNREHVASCGKTLYGEGASSSLDMRLVLLSEVFAVMERELMMLLSSELKMDERESVVSLLGMPTLQKNNNRLKWQRCTKTKQTKQR